MPYNHSVGCWQPEPDLRSICFIIKLLLLTNTLCNYFFIENYFRLDKNFHIQKKNARVVRQFGNNLIKCPTTRVIPCATSLSNNHPVSARIIPGTGCHYLTVSELLFLFVGLFFGETCHVHLLENNIPKNNNKASIFPNLLFPNLTYKRTAITVNVPTYDLDVTKAIL